MDTQRSSSLILLLLITISFHQTIPSSYAAPHDYNSLRNCSSSCGNIRNITFPFSLTTDPPNCGSQFVDFRLTCQVNRTIIKIKGEEYHVQAINYHNYTIRVASSHVEKGSCSVPSSSLSTRDIPWIFSAEKTYTTRTNPKIPEALKFLTCDIDNCPSTPFYTSSIDDLDSFVATENNPKFETEIRLRHRFETRSISETIIFLSCREPVHNNPSYIETSPCIKNNGNNYSYVVYGNGFKFSDMEKSCQVYRKAIVTSAKKGETQKKITSYKDIHNELSYGFELSWIQVFQEGDRDLCYVDEAHSNKVSCFPPGFCTTDSCRKDSKL